MEMKFDFNDVLIQANTYTSIKSRYTNIDPYYHYWEKNGSSRLIRTPTHLPILTAPMDTVVDFSNMDAFWGNYIAVTLPRTLKHEDFLAETAWDFGLPDFTFFSYGLDEFKKYYIDEPNQRLPQFVLIDVANGHIKDIRELVKQAKSFNDNLVVMAGNIASPDAYYEYAVDGNVDLIRVGIGNGNGCLTTKQTGIGYPNASLIHECNLIKQSLLEQARVNNRNMPVPSIIADGGMKDYSDIIIALALGADYVMVGSLFNKAIESKGVNYWNGIKLSQSTAEYLYHKGFKIKKQFYGMSTKIAQKKMGKTNLKTSEGVVRYREVEYTIYQWVDNFTSYLRSAMSYCDAQTLSQFIGKPKFNLITENAYNRFNK